MKIVIVLSLLFSGSLYAISSGQLQYNKKIAYQYCKQLSGIGSMTESVTYQKYYGTCLSLCYPAINKRPSMEDIRKELAK